MPGTKRRLRLVTDWTVDLVFDRDSSELGQLGHPPVLDAERAAIGDGHEAGAPADACPRPTAPRPGLSSLPMTLLERSRTT